jgi:hypothetical protein
MQNFPYVVRLHDVSKSTANGIGFSGRSPEEGWPDLDAAARHPGLSWVGSYLSKPRARGVRFYSFFLFGEALNAIISISRTRARHIEMELVKDQRHEKKSADSPQILIIRSGLARRSELPQRTYRHQQAPQDVFGPVRLSPEDL